MLGFFSNAECFFVIESCMIQWNSQVIQTGFPLYDTNPNKMHNFLGKQQILQICHTFASSLISPEMSIKNWMGPYQQTPK